MLQACVSNSVFSVNSYMPFVFTCKMERVGEDVEHWPGFCKW